MCTDESHLSLCVIQSQLPLCPLHCVRRALRQGRLCVTVPWVVDYLSMMDSLAPQLRPLRALSVLLLFIHR